MLKTETNVDVDVEDEFGGSVIIGIHNYYIK